MVPTFQPGVFYRSKSCLEFFHWCKVKTSSSVLTIQIRQELEAQPLFSSELRCCWCGLECLHLISCWRIGARSCRGARTRRSSGRGLILSIEKRFSNTQFTVYLTFFLSMQMIECFNREWIRYNIVPQPMWPDWFIVERP